MRNTAFFITILFLLESCAVFSPNDRIYDAVWNDSTKKFEKDLVQLGYLVPSFIAENYKKRNDSVFIDAITNFNFILIDEKKLLIECDSNGNIVDTLLIMKNEEYISFKYKKRKDFFFVILKEGENRGAYRDDKSFRRQSR